MSGKMSPCPVCGEFLYAPLAAAVADEKQPETCPRGAA